jgi:peroxiredoxin
MMDFDVVELGETDHVETGDEAPDFTRPLVGAEYWADASLSDLTAASPVLLVFHSMDGAFPATYTWKELTGRAFDETYDVQVVGVSISTPYEHKDLIDARGMDYRLFSDPANGVAAEYGVVHDLDGMAGVTEPRPAVFLVDTDMTVRYDWVATEHPEFPDYDGIDAALADL